MALPGTGEFDGFAFPVAFDLGYVVLKFVQVVIQALEEALDIEVAVGLIGQAHGGEKPAWPSRANWQPLPAMDSTWMLKPRYWPTFCG